MEKKYELTTETKEVCGVKLYRIKAVKSFRDVKEGELGGWIEKEENLSHLGNCWVSREAHVYGKAQVYGKAHVSGEARVFGEARVYGKAQVYGKAHVSGEAHVDGEARVFGEARVSGEAHVYGEARVSGEAHVYGEAHVSGEAWVYGGCTIGPIILTGFPHTVTITDKEIKVGCQFHSKEVWKERGVAIIKADGHTTEQAKSWANIINNCAEAHTAMLKGE